MTIPYRVGRLLVLLLVFGSAIPLSDAIAQQQPLRIVTFGTSLTARGGWQAPLADELGRCLGRQVEISIVARSGGTSDWAVSAVDEVVAASPDIVLLELYANDAALNRMMTVGRSRENLRTILQQLRHRLPLVRVIAMGMNPFSGLRGMMRPFSDSFVDAHRLLALEYDFEFVDHRPNWLARSEAWREEAIPDGLHPQPLFAAEVMVSVLASQIARGARRPAHH